MFEILRNIFSIPDLRQRIFFTVALLAVYRVGCNIPLPGIDLGVLHELTSQVQGSLLGYINLFSGGSLERAAIFALGIMPYITASIVLQLLTVAVPKLEKLAKEGELGRRVITRYTRYLTLVIALIESLSVALTVESMMSPAGAPLVPHPGWSFRLLTALTLTCGCCVVMWLGEQITERGLGNGISLIIFVGIVATLPGGVIRVYAQMQGGGLHPATVASWLIFLGLLIRFIVHMERMQRRIPVQYARRVVGNRATGGQSSHLPLKVNTAGVIPVIFASAILVMPQALAGLTPWARPVADSLRQGQPLYFLLYTAAVVFFTLFYVSIIFNPTETAENLRRQGGFIPGIRAGRPTAEYLDRTMTRLTWVGAFYLAGVAVLPELVMVGFRAESLPWIGTAIDGVLPAWMTTGIGIDFHLGGTSILIMVSVAMDFVRQVESQLVMHHYDGFLSKCHRRPRRQGGEAWA